MYRMSVQSTIHAGGHEPHPLQAAPQFGQTPALPIATSWILYRRAESMFEAVAAGGA